MKPLLLALTLWVSACGPSGSNEEGNTDEARGKAAPAKVARTAFECIERRNEETLKKAQGNAVTDAQIKSIVDECRAEAERTSPQ